MQRPPPRLLFLATIALAPACGPQAPGSADGSTDTGTTAPTPEPSSGDIGEPDPTSDGPPATTSGAIDSTTSTSSTSATSSTSDASSTTSTSSDIDPSTSTFDPGDGSTSGDTTTGEPAPCGPLCEATRETCPLAAQTNASVAGETPMGAFSATFAVQSLPNVFGPHIYMLLLPAYSDGELCVRTPQLRLTLPGPCWEAEPELAAPIELVVGDEVIAATTALLHNYQCTWWGFQCSACEGHLAFDLEVDADGWSLGGSVDAGCCRSFYDNNTP